jgi:hypothetical protein
MYETYDNLVWGKILINKSKFTIQIGDFWGSSLCLRTGKGEESKQNNIL